MGNPSPSPITAQSPPWPLPSLRRASLEQTLQQAELLHSCEEEEAWLREHGQLVEDASLGPDLSQIAAALQKHKVPSTLHPGSCPLPAIHPFPHPAPSSVLLQALEAELHRHQAVCADLVQRGRKLGACGPPTWPDPWERAEVVQGMWQQLWARMDEQGVRLQAALLVQQVAGQWELGGRAGSAGSAHVCPACPPPHSTSWTWRRQTHGFRSSGLHWRVHPLDRTRWPPRPYCGNTCVWNALCAPSGPSCVD